MAKDLPTDRKKFAHIVTLRFEGVRWKLLEEVDKDGFLNVFLKRGRRNFCLSSDHDSILDCFHLHGVELYAIVSPELSMYYKPWESDRCLAEVWVQAARLDLKMNRPPACPRCDGVYNIP